jgi:Flp pilus assembly protein TadG
VRIAVRGRRRQQGGQSVVEFALILPLILLLFFGAIDLGRAVFAYNTLAQAAREGNRVAIVNQTESVVKARVIGAAVTLGLGSSSVDVCYKTSTSTQRSCAAVTTDNCPQSTRTIGCLAIVTARTTYRPMTPIIGQLFGTVSLSSTSVGPIEAVCPDTGSTCSWTTAPSATPTP